MQRFTENVFDLTEMREQIRVFVDRKHAGEILGDMLLSFRNSNAVLLGIPAGGLPVAVAIQKIIGIELDVAVVNKITLPWNTESGYGAVAFDGTCRLNEAMLAHIRLSEDQIKEGQVNTLKKVNRRVKRLRKGRPFPVLTDRAVLLVDDGLASGFTMLVAAEAVKRAGAASITVAVPTGHLESIHRIVEQVDAIYCPNIRSGMRFAVADAYENWSDVTEEALPGLLEKGRNEALKTLNSGSD
ncbi:MAG: phosphoribosyltransferase family protein [Deltaproteobacteria bacterium]